MFFLFFRGVYSMKTYGFQRTGHMDTGSNLPYHREQAAVATEQAQSANGFSASACGCIPKRAESWAVISAPWIVASHLHILKP